LSEELFLRLFPNEQGEVRSVALAEWPSWNENLVADTLMDVPITVNGRKRAVVTLPVDASEDQLRAAALADPAIKRTLGDKVPGRVIVARSGSGALVNIVATG